MRGIVKTLIIILILLIVFDSILIYVANNVDFDSGDFLADNSGSGLLGGNNNSSSGTGNYLGSSFDNAIVIDAINEGQGLSKEHEWLGNNACIGKTPEQDLYEELIEHNESWYDKFIITCNNGDKETYYFNVDSFNGKWE